MTCERAQHGNTREKCQISETPRTNVFLKAALYFHLVFGRHSCNRKISSGNSNEWNISISASTLQV